MFHMYFTNKNYFSKSKKNCGKSGIVLHFCRSNLFSVWILISSSPFSLLEYVVSIEGYEENLVSRICSWKVLGNLRGL